MVTDLMMIVQEKTVAQFDCVNDWFADPDLGFKVLPISGYFVRSVAFDEFISRVKAMLPDDVKLMLYDGQPIRRYIPKDEYMIVFGSKTWEKVAEGQIIPRLEPLFLGEAAGDPIRDLRIISVPDDIELCVIINKQTHAFIIPKGEETDDQCVVRVRPKRENTAA